MNNNIFTIELRIIKGVFYVIFSIKLYLQLLHNRKRLRMTGYNYEYLILNIFMFTLLNLFYLLIFLYLNLSCNIEEYIFSLHSLFLYLLFLYQSTHDPEFKIKRKLRFLSKMIIILSLFGYSILVIVEFLLKYYTISKNKFFNSSTYLLYMIMFIHCMKYIPQLKDNYHSKSFYSTNLFIILSNLISHLILLIFFGIFIFNNNWLDSQLKFFIIYGIIMTVMGLLFNIGLFIQYFWLYKDHTNDTGNKYFLNNVLEIQID